MNRNLKRSLPAAVVLVAIGFGAYFLNVAIQTHLGKAAIADTGLSFRTLPGALAQSKLTNKPVFVDFSAIWCPVCRAMHEQVFTNPNVKRKLSEAYVLARVDYESDEAKPFMERYGVRGFPSLLVLAADGTLIRRVPVNMDPTAFAASLGE